tara:strand:+ start:412 stop:555 length:144 start_codon:yes stop_codon:yes gene_type:complete
MPYSGSYLSIREVNRIVRVAALALTGEDENPEPLRIERDNKIMERER